jgi:hypothetical protein
VKIDKLTINEWLIPDEPSTNGGDPILGGDNLATQQHTLVTEQPVEEHTLTPPNSPTSCDDNAALREPRTIRSNVDLNDQLHLNHLSQSPMEAVAQYQAILRGARANKMISPGGITDLRTRPPSPTNLCDFPYYECQKMRFYNNTRLYHFP